MTLNLKLNPGTDVYSLYQKSKLHYHLKLLLQTPNLQPPSQVEAPLSTSPLYLNLDPYPKLQTLTLTLTLTLPLTSIPMRRRMQHPTPVEALL